VFETCVAAVGDRVPVIPGIAALATAEAVQLARDARSLGCSGLMVLPPYVYSTDWREMKAHVAAVIAATDLPCLLYNNPVAYRTDFTPEQIRELAREHPNLQAVKESSTDVRRVTAIRALLGSRLDVLVGVDDAIVEGIEAGAVGWIAGLANAFPTESVALYRLAREGRKDEAFELYRWFLPLLRMDTVPKFVQLIKLAQEKVGRGSAVVRPPRLPLDAEELSHAFETIDAALASRPKPGT
jgi:4-hydroxy-tetrahydrodipicolinate synthase